MHETTHKYKAGNLVWANSEPALILPNNTLSYFNFKPRQPITQSTHLLPFTSLPTLRTLIPTITDTTLRNFALKLWAQNVVVESLTCKCVVPGFERVEDGRFAGEELVGFLRCLAVRPWVEDDEVVEAVTAAARVKAVRRFLVWKQKGIYKQEKKRTSRFMQSFSDVEAIGEYPEASNFKDKFESSDREEQHLTASVTLGKSLQPLHNDHLPNLSKSGSELYNEEPVQYLLACLRIIASNPFVFGEEEVRCLNTVKPSILTFRNLAYKNISGLCPSKCSHGNGETHFSRSELHGITTHTQVADDQINRSGNEKISSSLIPSEKSFVSFGLKRKFNQINSFGPCSKLQKTAFSISCKEAESGLENAPRIKNGHAGFSSNYVSQSQQKDQHLMMQPINDNDATSIDSNEGTTNFGWKSNLNEIGQLNRPLPPQTSIKSPKKLRPGGLTASAYKAKILHMKFPRDFHLPSKEELVKIFSSFGPIDVPKTKVYSYTGSAQVAYLHDTDAVVAYQYAKRKKVLFGQTNVLYWLDPFENKRKGTEVSVYSSLVSTKHPGLKSCLKRSNPLDKGVGKKSYRVSFRMETP